MGIDRIQYREQPCLCGKGTFVVDCCSADQPFVNPPPWFEFTINCESCKKEYELQDRYNEAVVVRRSDIEARAKKQKEYFAATTELMNSEEAEGYLKEFEQRLASIGTLVGQQRMLKSAGMTPPAIQTFRRDVKAAGITRYFRQHFYHYQLRGLLRYLGHANDPLIEKLEELGRVDKESQLPPEVVATLGCTLTMEAFYKS